MKVNTIYKLWDDPVVYAGVGTKEWGRLEGAPDRPAYMLTHPMWHFGLKSVPFFRRHARDLARRNVRMLLLTNTENERALGRLFGLRTAFANRNMHVCEHDLIPLDDEPKTHDAVYIAAAKPYKRLHLAAKIDRLFVVTYFWPDVRDEHGNWDLHAFEPRISHADFNRQRIDKTELNVVLNRSACGLALSKREGAMVAVMEYLLAGIPVVSTKSQGGRDLWFDDRFVEMVRPNADEVARGVRRFVENPVDPQLIRDETLRRLMDQRRRYHEVLAEVIREGGGSPPPFEDFHDRFWGDEGIVKLVFHE